jgi:hypothetical protein
MDIFLALLRHLTVAIYLGLFVVSLVLVLRRGDFRQALLAAWGAIVCFLLQFVALQNIMMPIFRREHSGEISTFVKTLLPFNSMIPHLSLGVSFTLLVLAVSWFHKGFQGKGVFIFSLVLLSLVLVALLLLLCSNQAMVELMIRQGIEHSR